MTGRILIVDDVATNRIVLKVKLEAVFYTALLASSGVQALQIARSERPDLILLDLMLTDMDGSEVLAQLRADPATANIPVIILSSTHDAQARLTALAAGADDFLTKPVADTVLLARLRNLLRAHGADGGFAMVADALAFPGLAEEAVQYTHPARIAIISDRPDQALRWRRELAEAFPGDYAVQTVEQALMTGHGPTGDEGDGRDIYLIDAGIGNGNSALNLLSDLRSRGPSRHASICIIGSTIAPDRLAMAFDIGANDVIVTGVSVAEVGLRLQTLLTRKRAADRARASISDGLRMAMIDPLTGLYNRRYALPHLSRVAEAAQADGSVFAVMVIDLDCFKAVNDRHGHAAGDIVLARVAQRLSTNLRNADMIARIGGEEFLVVLPDTTHAEAQIAAERLCRIVKDTPIALDNGTMVPMTISIGLAFSTAQTSTGQTGTGQTGTGQTSTGQTSPTGLIDNADKALLRSKAAGRNRVTIHLRAA